MEATNSVCTKRVSAPRRRFIQGMAATAALAGLPGPAPRATARVDALLAPVPAAAGICRAVAAADRRAAGHGQTRRPDGRERQPGGGGGRAHHRPGLARQQPRMRRFPTVPRARRSWVNSSTTTSRSTPHRGWVSRRNRGGRRIRAFPRWTSIPCTGSVPAADPLLYDPRDRAKLAHERRAACSRTCPGWPTGAPSSPIRATTST